MSKSYPYGETINNIQRKKEDPYNTEFIPAIGTVKDELSHLTKGGFLVRDHREEVDQKTTKRVFRYHIENFNSVINGNDRPEMQYAPGYVKYDTRFPDFWNKIVEDEDLDEVYPILIRIIRKAFTKMYSPDFDIKDLIPQMGASMLCKNCGVNHEARDFIRALLLRVIDQLEINLEFIRFMAEKRLFNDEGSDLYHHAYDNNKLRTAKVVHQKQYLREQPNKKRDKIKLRILSIMRDEGSDQIFFIAINSHQDFFHGTVDSPLVSDDIKPDRMIECVPSEIYPPDSYGQPYYINLYNIAAASLVPNASAQPSGQQKGEKATPKELVTTGMLNATSNATKSPSAIGGANMTNQTTAQK